MKNTIIAIVLLIIVIGFVVVNAFIVANITDELLKLTEQESELSNLVEYWDKKSYYLSISTHLSVLEDADKALCDMKSYHESKDEKEYYTAKIKFINSLDEIATGEKFSFYNIF